MLSLHRATVTEGVLKLSWTWTNVIFVDLGITVDGSYYHDLFLSEQLLPVIYRASS